MSFIFGLVIGAALGATVLYAFVRKQLASVAAAVPAAVVAVEKKL